MISATTNTAANSAHRFLNQASSGASSSIAKMSSGSRIVKASDDASSLAISNKLRADIASLEQASRNASQGASMVQVATGAMDRIGDILTRMKTLSTQSVNGTLSTAERQFAQAEFSSLRTQIGEIASQTRVNGNAILNGGDKTVASAVANNTTAGVTGLTANGAFEVDDFTAFTGRVEGLAEDVTVTEIGTTYQVDITIGGEVFRGHFSASAVADTTAQFVSQTNSHNTFTLIADAAAIDATGNSAALTTEFETFLGLDAATANTPPALFQSSALADPTALISATAADITEAIDASGSTVDGKYTLTSSWTQRDATTGQEESLTLRLQDDNGNVYEAVVQDESTGAANAGVFLAAGETKTVTFGNGIELNFTAAELNALDTAPLGGAAGQSVQFTVNAGAATTATFQVGDRSSDTLVIAFDAMSTSTLGLDGLTIETVAGAQAASTALDSAINTVNGATANLGAIQSRLEQVQSNLATVTENLKAANGTFRDVDMASEMTEFTKQQTLMQASISMLSQANQQPQLLLRLLG